MFLLLGAINNLVVLLLISVHAATLSPVTTSKPGQRPSNLNYILPQSGYILIIQQSLYQHALRSLNQRVTPPRSLLDHSLSIQVPITMRHSDGHLAGRAWCVLLDLPCD